MVITTSEHIEGVGERLQDRSKEACSTRNIVPIRRAVENKDIKKFVRDTKKREKDANI